MAISKRRIWARGLTANENGRAIEFPQGEVLFSDRHFLRHAEHLNGRTVLTVVTTIEVAPDAEVVIYE